MQLICDYAKNFFPQSEKEEVMSKLEIYFPPVITHQNFHLEYLLIFENCKNEEYTYTRNFISDIFTASVIYNYCGRFYNYRARRLLYMEQKSIVYFFQVQVYYHEGAVAIFKLTFAKKSVKIDLMTM